MQYLGDGACLGAIVRRWGMLGVLGDGTYLGAIVAARLGAIVR